MMSDVQVGCQTKVFSFLSKTVYIIQKHELLTQLLFHTLASILQRFYWFLSEIEKEFHVNS